MARHNEVFLCGALANDPQIIAKKVKNPETGEDEIRYLRACLQILTIIGERDYSSYIDKLETYTIPVITKDEDMVKKIINWRRHDMVELKGVVSTQNVIKQRKCTCCGHVNRIENGQISYVTPIYIGRRETGVSQEQIKILLRERCEISNTVLIIGNLCANPDNYHVGRRGMASIHYQLGVPRKYYVKDDDPKNKNDYPHVRAYGKMAEDSYEVLMEKSLVLIDGFLSTRPVSREKKCDECGEIMKWDDWAAMEIVPYSFEPLKNCKEFKTGEEAADEILKSD